jgi:hypothetical protein
MKRTLQICLSFFLILCTSFLSADMLTKENLVKKNTRDFFKKELSINSSDLKSFYWNEGISLPFAKPDAISFTMSNHSEIVCNGVQPPAFEQFKNSLVNEGWIQIGEPGYSTDYSFVKGNMVLSILDQSFAFDEQSENNYISITLLDGVSGTKDRPNAIPKDLAKAMIQEEIDKTEGFEGTDVKTIACLVELDYAEAFDTFGIQAYIAFSSDSQIGNFIICNGCVQFGFAFGEPTIADIDKDGKYEMICVGGWGYGIYRIEIMAYKFGSTSDADQNTECLYVAYYNCWVPDNGYAELTLKKVSATQVKLYGVDWINGELKLINDYGELRVDGNQLKPQNEIDFPFQEWN